MRPTLDRTVTVLITGASSGIGRELAREFAPRVGRLVLVARRRERLDELKTELEGQHKGLSVHPMPCDLADADARESLFAQLERDGLDVDVLVNDAGLGDLALYDRAKWDRIDPILQVNVVALAHLTHHLLPPMVERNRGGILNIGSGAGHVVMAASAAYVASKHFVDGFTKALQVDLMGTRVVVSQASPGPVRTEFGQVAGFHAHNPGGPPDALRTPLKTCARDIVRSFARGQAEIYPGFLYRQLMRAQSLLPRDLSRWLVQAALKGQVRLLRRGTGPPP